MPRVPGYELLSELGRGGMGVVYKARQTGLDRLVALKMVLSGAHAGAEQLARFHTEAQAVAHLKHPNIVQIYDVGECDGLPFFSLEFLDGGNLSDRIDSRPQTPRFAAETVAKLASAMFEAHKRNIIHRDLKPANVLLADDGEPKITDFGLAKRLEGDSKQTRSGAIMGTPSYMSPEQALGQTREIGPSSDQYALGAILYELLTGRPPFQGATPIETLELVRRQEPVPPTRLQPRIPRDLETICLKALAKEPRKRYEDVGALAADLHRFLDGEPIQARPVGLPERSWRWCRRHPKEAALIAAVVTLLMTVTGVSIGAAVQFNSMNKELRISQNAALTARKIAERKRGEAEAASELARKNKIAAESARDLAKEQKEKAEAVARSAFDQNKFTLQSLRYLSVLAIQRLKGVPGTQEIQAELLKTSLRDLKDGTEKMAAIARQARGLEVFDAALAERTMAGIHQQTGRVFEEIGQPDLAGEQYRMMDERARRFGPPIPTISNRSRSSRRAAAPWGTTTTAPSAMPRRPLPIIRKPMTCAAAGSSASRATMTRKSPRPTPSGRLPGSGSTWASRGRPATSTRSRSACASSSPTRRSRCWSCAGSSAACTTSWGTSASP